MVCYYLAEFNIVKEEREPFPLWLGAWRDHRVFAITGGWGGGKLPLPPLWRGRVIYTVAALEEPYPGRYLPMEGMKPTLQLQMLAGALVTPAGLFSGISWFSGRVVSFPFTPSIS